MPRPSLLALFFFSWLPLAGWTSLTACAADPSPPPASAIWSGLVLATNDTRPAQAPARLRALADKLRNIFGYNQFELVGEASQKMEGPVERWLTPSKDFSLSVKTHPQPGQHYPMKIVLFQNRRRLAEFEAHLYPDSPLFIRGPLYAGGQLVIVLRVMDPAEIQALAVKAPVLAANPSPVLAPAPTKQKLNPPPVAVAAIPAVRAKPVPAALPAIFSGHSAPVLSDRPVDAGPKLGKPQ